MTFGESISTCLSKYATFDGRATRSEYWWFYLFTFLLGIGAAIIGDMIAHDGGNAFSLLVNLAMLLPTLAVGARRLHDTDRSAWWLLLILTGIGVILLIIWFVMEGTQGDNEYGAKPAK